MSELNKEIINKKMIKDFLIINCTGKNDSIGLRVNNNFFMEKFQTNIKNNDMLVDKILKFLKRHKAKLIKTFQLLLILDLVAFQQ